MKVSFAKTMRSGPLTPFRVYSRFHHRVMRRWMEREALAHPEDPIIVRWREAKNEATDYSVPFEMIKARWEYERLHRPWWDRLARATIFRAHWWWQDHTPRWWQDHTPRRWPRYVRYCFQRVRRGWDDHDTWNLDETICKRVGEMLIHLSEISHGWDDHHYASYEEEMADIRSKGQALVDYARGRWDPDHFGDGGKKRYAAAQDALRWVADNLDTLWDWPRLAPVTTFQGQPWTKEETCEQRNSQDRSEGGDDGGWQEARF